MLVAGKFGGALTYVEITKLGTMEKIEQEIVDTVFRKLENERSTKKLITGVLKGTNVTLAQERLDELLMYMELRHILVHRAGKLDQRFIEKYEAPSKLILKVDRKMPMTIGFVRRGLAIAEEVAESIDSQVMKESVGEIA